MTVPMRKKRLERAFSEAGVASDIAVFLLDRTGNSETLHGLAKRHADYRAGREAAACGLVALGLPAQEIGREESRAPLWPKGIVGSITHTPSLAVTVICKTGDLSARSVGIDAERIGGVEDTNYDALFTEDEKSLLARLTPAVRAIAATCVFSAKEALYKAQFPITRAFVDFTEVSLCPTSEFEVDEGTWRLQHSVPALEPFRFTLFHRRYGDHIITGCTAQVAAK